MHQTIIQYNKQTYTKLSNQQRQTTNRYAVINKQTNRQQIDAVKKSVVNRYNEEQTDKSLKGVFAKNERGYRLNAIKKRF